MLQCVLQPLQSLHGIRREFQLPRLAKKPFDVLKPEIPEGVEYVILV